MASFSDIKLEASNLAATKPKHVFGKIKRQKLSLLAKPSKNQRHSQKTGKEIH